MIAGLVPATSGRIVVGGQDLTEVPTHRRDMGLVFQSYALFPHMSVARNVAFGLRDAQVAEGRDRTAGEGERSRSSTSGKEEHKPSQLSGGQQQRVALARALVVRPRSCCSTSRSRISTPNCATRCATRSATSRSGSASPQSS
jgi:putative spermidine/putrescine transport system ATP-binding protein